MSFTILSDGVGPF